MTKKTRNWLVAIFIVSFPFVLFFGFLIFMASEPLPPLGPVPVPNAYEDLVKASKMLNGDTLDFEKTDLKKLRELVSTNAAALAFARIALTNQCAVPAQFTTAYMTNHTQDLLAFRELARALECEGKLAEKENRFGDAAKSYLDSFTLGNQISHGGVLVDEMIGIAIWGLGGAELQGVVTNLDATACRNAAATLETITANRQTWAATMQQEEAWSRRTFGWRQEWMKWLNYSTRQKNLRRAMDMLHDREQQEGRLLVDLAARAYKLEKGKQPASLADLVPDYLKTIPQDPITGTNMVYLPQ